MDDGLSELLLLDEDELFEMLGKTANPKDFGLNDVQAYVRLGRAWFQQYARQLQSQICSNNGVQVLLEGTAEYDSLVEAAIVVDALAGLFDQKMIYLFAVLVTRHGLLTYCSSPRDRS